MKFGEPHLLWSLVLAPLCAVLFILAARAKRRRWEKVSDRSLFLRQAKQRSSTKLVWRSVLWCLGVGLACLALARPQYGASTVKQTRRGLDLVIAIDTSKSMLAKDLLPDRLSRAKLELQALLEQLQGDRVGFVAFAGQAFVQCPLTSDYAAAKIFLRALDTKTIPRGGTAIAEALRTADGLLDEARTRGGSKSQVVVVITDGEDHEGEAVVAAKTLRDKGVSVFTVGVGSTVGEPIPLYNDRGEFTGYMKDARGNTVLSRLNENILKEVAAAGGGRYVASTSGSTGVEALVTELAGYEREEREAKFKVVYADRFQWVLVPGALVLLLAFALSPRRRLVALLVLLIPGFADAAVPWPTLQNATVKGANTALAEGRPDEALQQYETVKEELSHRAELWLNQGMAHLKKGDPKAAEPLLQRALLSEDKKLRGKAHYLLGNAAFDAKDYKVAIDEYKKSLKDDPRVQETKHNLELAQKLLKQEQDSQKKDEQKKDDQKKQDEKKQQDQKQDDKQQQDQQKQDQQKQDQQKQEQQKQEQQKQEEQQQQQQQEQQAGEDNRPKDDKEQSRMQLLDSLQAEERPLRFDMFKGQQQKKTNKKTVEKDW